MKDAFEQAATEELARVGNLLKRPYPDPTTYYQDAQTAVKAAENARREEKVKKSKAAFESFEKYHAMLPVSSKTQITRLEFEIVLTVIDRFLSLHAEKQLTLKSAQDAMERISIGWRQEKFRGVLDTFVLIGGDYRLGHDPDKPSLAETAAELKRLFEASIDK